MEENHEWCSLAEVKAVQTTVDQKAKELEEKFIHTINLVSDDIIEPNVTEAKQYRSYTIFTLYGKGKICRRYIYNKNINHVLIYICNAGCSTIP